MKSKLIGFLIILATIVPVQVNGKAQWRVFFSTPYLKHSKGSPLEKNFVKLINHSKKSFYGAFFEISSDKIVKALLRARKRGNIVKLVTDDMHLKKDDVREKIEALSEAGVEIVFDKRRPFMHNKFAIIDDRYLWTGSYNITKNGGYKNNNNAIVIDSKKLARIYKKEFNEMFEDKIFGNKKDSSFFKGRYYAKVGSTPVNVYFSPENKVENIIIKRINKAKKSIVFMAFSFTSDPIGEAMIKKFKSGVKVAGLFEKRGAGSRYSEYTKMKVEGIPVKKDRNKRAMHHKVIIIDGETVITGSYNFSKNASKRNDENVLIIKNSSLARKYLAEFKRLTR